MDRPAHYKRGVGTDRGQTVVDFAIGAGVFLITVGVVFAFVPTMFEPFTSATGSAPATADRSIDYLSAELLAVDRSSPAVLSAACTTAFFAEDGGLSEDANCGFNAEEPLNELIGVGDREVNVTVRELEDSPRTGPAVESSFDGTTLTRGSDETSRSVTVASRIVSIDGEQYRLVLKVW